MFCLHSCAFFFYWNLLKIGILLYGMWFDMLYQQAGSPLVDKFSKLGGKVCANSIEAGKGEIWIHIFFRFPIPSFLFQIFVLMFG